MEKKVLNLSVNKEWYDKIMSGEKTEEYREIKPYWVGRLLQGFPGTNFQKIAFAFEGRTLTLRSLLNEGYYVPKDYTHVRFTNGYPKGGIPYIEKEIVSITIGKPKKGLCSDKWLDKEFFVIKFK